MTIKKILEGRVPVKIWCDAVEPQAEQQLLNTAALPFVFKHVAAMPDVHLGIGATVGSVVATKGAIVPAAVGVDIGCGMMAVKLDVDKEHVIGKIKEIRSAIEDLIPVGFHQNKEVVAAVADWPRWLHNLQRGEDLKNKAAHQMGTLGGGNHFIEVCLDKQSNVWVMLHSGSRNVGKMIAERYIDEAKKLMNAYFIQLHDPNLAYLAEGTKEFTEYIYDLTWCQDYAMANRQEMMRRVIIAIGRVMFNRPVSDAVVKLTEVNCHHNYVALENHFGANVFVTRKGAVRAREGDMGIIPGSMGTGSFIVRGLGNPDSFCSCSHGAGRRMSRTQAKKQFTLADLTEQTAGVECRKDIDVIDEIPGAYKDINEVMANQSDLVTVVAELKQILCVKG